MKVNKDTLKKITQLARLDFEEENEEKMLGDLNKILDWMNTLQEIDTSEIEPLIHLSEEINQMREDELKSPLDHEKALKNAPQKDKDYFRVPKFLE